MADAKISALTALTGANIATDDEIPIVDTSVTTTKKTTMADLSSRTETMTNKTLTSPVINTPTIDEAVISGTPDAAGELGRDTTQLAPNWYDNGQVGTIPKVINVGVGTQTFTNDATTDKDFTSLYTLPANAIFTNKVYRVTLFLEQVHGVSSVTRTYYLKMGATKVYTGGASNAAASVTRSLVLVLYVFGRAAAGAAANVSTASLAATFNLGDSNAVDQPVALATNGTLAITPGITYSGTGSTETDELQGWLVEELN
jgi:hypothetical protein